LRPAVLKTFKGNYYISIPKGTDPHTDNTRNIDEEYHEGGSGSGMKWDVMSEDCGKHEYCRDTENALSLSTDVDKNQTITYKDKVIHINRYYK